MTDSVLLVSIDSSLPTSLPNQLLRVVSASAQLFGLAVEARPAREAHVAVSARRFEEWRTEPLGADLDVVIEEGVNIGGAFASGGATDGYRELSACTVAYRNRLRPKSSFTQVGIDQVTGTVGSAVTEFLSLTHRAQLLASITNVRRAEMLLELLKSAIGAIDRYDVGEQQKLNREKASLLNDLRTLVRRVEEASPQSKYTIVGEAVTKVVELIGSAPAKGLRGIDYGTPGRPVETLIWFCDSVQLDLEVARYLPATTWPDPPAAGNSSSAFGAKTPLTEPIESEKQLRWEDELAGHIGHICRADVRVELLVRMLYKGLAGGIEPLAVPGQLGRLLDDCEAIVAREQPPSPRSKRALEAIDKARMAHAARNRMVHDLWLPTYPHYDRPEAVRMDLRSFGAELIPHDDIEQLTFDDLRGVRGELEAAGDAIAAATLEGGFIPLTDDQRRR